MDQRGPRYLVRPVYSNVGFSIVKWGVLKEEGHALWSLTDKGMAVAREFKLVTYDGVLIDRALLRKQLPDLAAEFERTYRVVTRPGPLPPPAPAAVVSLEK